MLPRRLSASPLPGLCALGVLVVGLLVAVACAPAAPAPAASPAKPTAAPAAPAKPAASAASAPSSSAAGGGWQAEWDKVVAAAKQEGTVVVAGGRAEPYRVAAEAFQKAYPDIKLDYEGITGADFAPRILAERNAGKFLWDVHMSGATTMVSTFKPKGVLDPLKPALILPEVLDNSKWLGGLDDGWMDKEHEYVYDFDGTVAYLFTVNRDVVPESKLNKIDQLLDPQWKGKISVLDPRVNGPTASGIGTILMVKGEDWLRKFLAQDLIITQEARQQTEYVVRGQYPIGLRLDSANIKFFTQQGLGKNLKPLDPTSPAAGAIGGGYGSIVLINKAPHPNAAKVFINWWLSKAGQEAYVKAANANSRRLDVQGPAETQPNPNIKYPPIGKEENVSYIKKAQEIAKEILK